MRGGTLVAAPFLDIASRISCCGERGLLGLAFHPGLCPERPLLRQLHEPAGEHAHLRVPRLVEPGRGGSRHRAAAPVRGAALREPQRRRPGLRQRRPALHRPRRRRVGRRSPGQRPGPRHAPGQDAPHRRGLRHALRGALRQPVPHDIPARGRRSGRWACATRGGSPSTAARASCTSRTWARARARRSTWPPAGRGGQNYGWNVMEGTACFSPGSGCNMAGLDPARPRLRARRRRLDHRRLRLPRLPPARLPRDVFLRRLHQRHPPLLPLPERPGHRPARLVGHDRPRHRQHQLVRPGRRGRAVRRRLRRRGVPHRSRPLTLGATDGFQRRERRGAQRAQRVRRMILCFSVFSANSVFSAFLPFGPVALRHAFTGCDLSPQPATPVPRRRL